MRLLQFAVICALLNFASGKTYEEEVDHLPHGCPTFESWRLSNRCAYAYESKDCSGRVLAPNVNETMEHRPHQQNSVNFVLVRPGCVFNLWRRFDGWGISSPIYEFPQSLRFDTIDCNCATDDRKALTCVPRRKLVPAGNCTSSPHLQALCTYNVTSGVFKIGEKTEIGFPTKGFVLERVGFYETFNGTDQLVSVDDVQQYRGSASGVLTLGNTLGGPETFAVWQVSYICGGYQAFIAKTVLTVDVPDTQHRPNIVEGKCLKQVRKFA